MLFRRRHPAAYLALIGVAAAALCVVACSNKRPPTLDGSGTPGTNPGGTNNVLTGPCSPEGTTVACHYETGRVGNIVNCFAGTQSCVGGVWSTCGGTVRTLSSVSLSSLSSLAAISRPPDGVGLSPKVVWVSDASTDAGGCATNPCNPYCTGQDIDAGLLSPGTGWNVQGSTSGIETYPAPKIVANATTCSQGSPPGDNNVCSYDYCCSSTTNACVRWIDLAGSANCTKPGTADYMVGIGCIDGAGKTHIPVCNRGLASSPGSGKLAVMGYAGNPPAAGNAAVCANSGTTPSEGCLIDLAVNPIGVNTCVEIIVQDAAAGTVPGMKCEGSADFSTGNRVMMVNPPATTTLPSALATNYGGSNYTQLADANLCDNYSFVYASPNTCLTYGVPPALSTSYTFTAVCPDGSRIRWNQFAYDTTVPNASNVLFKVSTAPVTADGGPGTFTTPVTVAQPANPVIVDPALCPMSGGGGCPKVLSTVLGADAAVNPLLKLDIVATPVSASPTIKSWQINYNCDPIE